MNIEYITDVDLVWFESRKPGPSNGGGDRDEIVQRTLHWRKKVVTAIGVDEYGRHEVSMWTPWVPVRVDDSPPEPPPGCPASPHYQERS